MDMSRHDEVVWIVGTWKDEKEPVAVLAYLAYDVTK